MQHTTSTKKGSRKKGSSKKGSSKKGERTGQPVGRTGSRRSRPLGIFGRGRLARAVASAAGDRVAWMCGRSEAPGPAVAVVVDCSLGEAVEAHVDWALESSTDLVIAATGWELEGLEDRVAERIGVVVAPNGSLTVAWMTRLSRAFGAFSAIRYGREAGGYLLDHHHAAKRDAPSGTALRLAEAWRQGAAEAADPGEAAPQLTVAALRAGHATGTHVLGLDAPGEQIEIVHRARSREPFAQGLLVAADWIVGRRGTFTMDHVAEATLGPIFGRSQG